MLRKYLFVLVLCLGISSLALADSDTYYPDDDTWNQDDDTGDNDDDSSSDCNTFCQKTTQCGISCLDEYCYNYCTDNAAKVTACFSLTECSAFEQCLCGDESSDDDNGEDDNSDGACSVADNGSAAVLPVVMAVVGLAALVWSVYKPRRPRVR